MPPTIVATGQNETPVWGMSARERLTRIGAAQGLAMDDGASAAIIAANLGYVFDPEWLRHLLANPGTVLTLGGVPALGHIDRSGAEAFAGGRVPTGATELAVETSGGIQNEALRKREVPFLLPLTRETVPAVERASYWGAYKGVTDLLTKYLWPRAAFHMTRAAAALGLTPNMVTYVGIALCLVATVCFWRADYWLGLVLGLVFMVLDTVDGKLARCTITSSKLGDVLDHGVDLVHPPFWWWAWLHGLAEYGRPLTEAAAFWTIGVIVGGYVVQRLIEGAFIASFGMHIHVWRRLDSQFRLVTARRNPNMVILFVALLAGRADLGIVAVACWTGLSCLFHAVRLVQAYVQRARGAPILSWLS